MRKADECGLPPPGLSLSEVKGGAGSSYFNEFVVFGIGCEKTFGVKDTLQNDGSTDHGTKEKV